MRLFFKVIIFILIIQPMNAQFEEENSSASRNKFQTFVGFSKAYALDDNFMGDAYNLKYGVELGGDYLFTENLFVGVQVDVLWTDVENPRAIGGIIRTRIISSSANIGYLLNITDNFDVSAKLGLGHGRYGHKADLNGRVFHDDAFISYIEPKLIYNLDKTFGVYLGSSFRFDKMSIETSEDYEDYFGNSTRVSINLGAQFSF